MSLNLVFPQKYRELFSPFGALGEKPELEDAVASCIPITLAEIMLFLSTSSPRTECLVCKRIINIQGHM